MFTTYNENDLQSQKINSTSELSDIPDDELPERYDLKKCCDWIRENNYQTTCLQFPESLLNHGTSIALYMQKVLERPVYVIADTSYGSCCVDEVAAQHINADSIIHFGHACLSPVTNLPVLYIFEKQDLDVGIFFDSCKLLRENIIIFYDDVYYHTYSELCSAFKNSSHVNVSNLCVNNKENGDIEKICGRTYTKNVGVKTSAVYIGNDSITLQNLVLGLPDLKWYIYSKPGKLEEYNFNVNKFLMQRSHLVERIKEAKVVGILIGTLGIKNYLDAIDRVKLLVKQKGKKYYLLAVGKPNVAKLANFPEINVFVYITCHENSLLKSFKDFYKPVVSLFEVEMALGDRPYSVEYTSDFKELLPGGVFYKEIGLDSEVSSNPKELSLDVVEKDPGTIMEYSGAEFLAKRTWRGLDLSENNLEVSKAVKGRIGIPEGYANELKTISEGNINKKCIARNNLE